MNRAAFLRICGIIVAMLVAPNPTNAQYILDGASVSTAPNGQWVKQVVTGGDGGAVMVWEDWRGASNDIYIQRVNAWGYSVWTADGAPLCMAAGQQQSPRLIPDGVGGALVAWSDSRSGSYMIYAQRVTGAGEAQWTADGIPIAEGTVWQQYPETVSDGAGGAVVFWQSGIGSEANIYAQRVTANGDLLWGSAGTAVCTETGLQSSLVAIPDGSGGGIVAWTDHRGTTDDIYAQRMDSGGVARWTPGGVPVCSAVRNQAIGGIAADGSGGAIMAWTDYRSGSNWQVYAQRIDSLGSAQWTANGVLVPTRPGNASSLRIAPDGIGGAFAVWVAASSGDSLFAERIDGNGAALWITPLSPSGAVSVSNLIPDGSGGAIISWEQGGDIYSQRVADDGAPLWRIDGVELCLATDAQRYPAIAPDGSGGVIAAWWDYRNSGGSAFEGDVYAGRIDAGGGIVPTLLESFASFVEGNAVVLRWSLTDMDENPQFLIRRAEHASGTFLPIADPPIECSGRFFAFRDCGCEPGRAYRYRVETIDGREAMLLFETDAITVPPIAPTLFQNYPNPFNPSTVIGYSLSQDGWVVLELFDVRGRLVSRLVDGYRTQGRYEVGWNGTDFSGDSVGSGVYWCLLKTGKTSASRKMVLTR